MSIQKKFGDFMRNVAHRKVALSESVGASGGYLVPQELLIDVQTILREEAVFHSLALQVPMSSRETLIPSVDLSAAHASGDSPLYGGFSSSWTAEGTEPPEDEPGFAGGKLVAKQLAVNVVASNQLVADGGEALGAYLEMMFVAAIEWTVERECFRGNGVGKPAGIVDSPATVTVARAAANAVAQVDLANMIQALLPACFARAVWCVNPGAMRDVSSLPAFGFFQYKGALPSLCGYLYGRPCYVTEKLPALGSKGDVVLFDPKMYALGFHNLEIASSRHPKFITNQTVFRVIWRGDGQTIPKGTAVLADGSTTAGAFVALAA